MMVISRAPLRARGGLASAWLTLAHHLNMLSICPCNELNRSFLGGLSLGGLGWRAHRSAQACLYVGFSNTCLSAVQIWHGAGNSMSRVRSTWSRHMHSLLLVQGRVCNAVTFTESSCAFLSDAPESVRDIRKRGTRACRLSAATHDHRRWLCTADSPCGAGPTFIARGRIGAIWKCLCKVV